MEMHAYLTLHGRFDESFGVIDSFRVKGWHAMHNQLGPSFQMRYLTLWQIWWLLQPDALDSFRVKGWHAMCNQLRPSFQMRVWYYTDNTKKSMCYNEWIKWRINKATNLYLNDGLVIALCSLLIFGSLELEFPLRTSNILK